MYLTGLSLIGKRSSKRLMKFEKSRALSVVIPETLYPVLHVINWFVENAELVLDGVQIMHRRLKALSNYLTPIEGEPIPFEDFDALAVWTLEAIAKGEMPPGRLSLLFDTIDFKAKQKKKEEIIAMFPASHLQDVIRKGS